MHGAHKNGDSAKRKSEKTRPLMHYEDFQSSMKKKMLGTCCTDDYKKEIRTHYYALVAEYDKMVGDILQAVEEVEFSMCVY